MRDFIANPKINGYQSIHVRIHEAGQNYLIKIRTVAMDEWATNGILGDWDAQKPLSDEHWQEVSELLRSIGEYGGAGPQRKALIRLSEAEEIFAYTPKGDIYYLPKGSVVLDFAYRIHSELGDYCEGAMVNGEWAPPTYVLKDGDTVEVVTSPDLLDADPSLEELCKTPKARTAINRQLQQKRRQYARDIGRQILFQEIRRHGLPLEVLDGEHIRLILEILNVKDSSELMVRLGQDLISPHLVLYYLETAPGERDRIQSAHETPPHEAVTISIAELDKAVHKLARCCNPYPGQQHVVATISERGTTFHHRECKDLHDRHDLQPQQLLNVHWEMDKPWHHHLIFHLFVLQQSVASLLPILSKISHPVDIRSIFNASHRQDQPMVKIVVGLSSFAEAREFFGLFPVGTLIIEDYGRDESPRRIQSSPLEAEGLERSPDRS
jgi:GTP pyrophosphokinase